MFIDHAKILIRSGKGGDGKVSFHTAKYVPNGGPDGGDGGKGGSVIFEADSNLSTLQDFRYKRKYIAEDGEMGGRRNKSGKDASDLIVRVPLGTLIKHAETGQILADLTEAGERAVLARGGRGGKGNARFANPVRQAPNFARAGEAAEELEVLVELKLLADVGLVGFPNVGKSTLLSVISSARPRIADYHFTTLQPNLGICEVDSQTFAVADIPGLIEGASEGLGLGHDFLRHIERTRLLLHLVDVSGSEGRNPIEDFQLINAELKQFSEALADRPQIVVATKIDLASEEQISAFTQEMEALGYSVYPICGPIHEGVEPLLKQVVERLSVLPQTILKQKQELDERTYTYVPFDFTVRKDEGGYVVEGKWIENLVASTNFEDVESLNYFQRQLKQRGVLDEMIRQGIREGDNVSMYGLEFDYIP